MATDQTNPAHVYPRDDSGATPRTWSVNEAGAVVVKCPECGTASTVAVGSIDQAGQTAICCPAKACLHKADVVLVGIEIGEPGVPTAFLEGR